MLSKTKSCYKCADRYVGCHATCERYVSVYKNMNSEIYLKLHKQKNNYGNFMGYIFYPDGRIKGKSIDFIKPRYKHGVPYVNLSENGINIEYRLDKAVYRAFHCDYNINNCSEIIHIDGDIKNCAIKNLYLSNISNIKDGVECQYN